MAHSTWKSPWFWLCLPLLAAVVLYLVVRCDVDRAVRRTQSQANGSLEPSPSQTSPSRELVP